MTQKKKPIPSKQQKSLWGDLEKLETVKTPAAYLQEQANILSESTGYNVIGRVEKRSTSRGEFEVDLDIVAPALNDYTVTALRVNHTLDFYPLRMKDFLNDQTHDCKNENEFLSQLESVLSSPNVHKALTTLISQST